jgi:hypothetical protein
MSDTFSYTIESNVFDWVRDDLGKAVTYCLSFLEKRMAINESRSECGRILFYYVKLNNKDVITRFTGMDDSQAAAKSLAVANAAGVSADLAYNVLFACYSGAQEGNAGCQNVLAAASGNNFLDTFQYDGVTGIVSKTISEGIDSIADGIGIPRTFITLALVVVVAFTAFYLIKKVKKL